MFRRKKRRRYLYILLFAVLLYTVHRVVLSFSEVKTYIYSGILYPVMLSQKHVVLPIKKFFENRKSNLELQNQLFELYEENKKITQENIKLCSTVSFYNKTKEVVDFAKKYKADKMQLCQILFRHITSSSHFVYVDKGARHGVLSDMVAVYKNCLLGRVTDVYPFYSKILLITDKSCKVASYCASTGSNGIHIGNNSIDSTSLHRVSHLSAVKKDDLVLSSGYGLVFPYGFALGKIVEYASGDLYHEITVSPLFDIKNIDYCFLLQKGEC